MKTVSPAGPCHHEWVLSMIEMPEGYSKPGAATCRKCGEPLNPEPAQIVTTTSDIPDPWNQKHTVKVP